jgi:23S rRNA-/tRNA-specific pseudouridylate synthase/SAM-dependent methyltransferase
MKRRARGRAARGGGPASLAFGVRVVHEDEHVLVIDKPAGLLSAAPAGSETPSAFASVLRHLRSRGRRSARAWLVHRLDREVSGLLLFARSESALAWLKQELRARRVQRTYLALVEGELGRDGSAPAEGVVSSFLRDGRARVESIAPEGFRGRAPGPGGADSDARLATTHYRLLGAGRGASALELTLDTGRRHQIRVHLQQLGHPVLGDRRYGARDGESRVWLHAARLAFHRPRSGQRLELESPPPREFWRRAGLRAPVRSAEMPETLDTSWEPVADWYDDLLSHRGSDHYRDLILPGSVRLLEVERGSRVLDLACGQGVLARRLAAAGAQVVGIDASPRMIEVARRRTRAAGIEYQVGDARALDPERLGLFDAIACVMALANIEPLEPMLRACARLLRPGGRWVAVLPHPAFRAPRQSSWGWDRAPDGAPLQYRRIDGYLSPAQVRIVANPGGVARGERAVETWTFHRPLQSYLRALAAAGLWLDALEEWPSLRTSQPGPRALAENRARREIPLFLALRARRVSGADA